MKYWEFSKKSIESPEQLWNEQAEQLVWTKNQQTIFQKKIMIIRSGSWIVD